MRVPGPRTRSSPAARIAGPAPATALGAALALALVCATIAPSSAQEPGQPPPPQHPAPPSGAEPPPPPGAAEAQPSADEPRPGGARARREEAAELRQRVLALPPLYRDWIQSVAGLITTHEVQYFLDLQEDYRRDAFMEAFWEPRDPDPATPQNELRIRWEEYKQAAGDVPFGDPRFVVYLLNGPPGRYSLPDGRPVSICYSRTEELEIWFYGGSQATSRRFIVVFLKRGADAPYEIYRPGGTLRTVQRSGGLPTTNVQMLCAEELLRFALYEIGSDGDYDDLIEEVLSPPIPSEEWLATFKASTTDLPEGAATFAVADEIRFPERNQSRTAMQVLLTVPLAEAPGRRFGDALHHNFVITGEVIRDGRLFESFNYRFQGETPENAHAIPIGFTRYLRSGPVNLRVLVEDVFGGRYAQLVRDLDIPSPEGLPQANLPTLGGPATGAAGAPTLELLAPPGNVQTGVVRFSARHAGTLDKVTFFLDDRAVLTKRSPPYSVELNLGSAPAPHRVRVVGYVGDREAATDQVWLNQGAQRFRVRMIEPRAGGIYPGSLTARIEVDTPDGKPPEQVELFVNDEPVATLMAAAPSPQAGTAPAYEHSLRLPGTELAVVRAVARLADGTTAEDAVIVNAAPGTVAEVEVRLVEVYALALDRQGRPVRGLTQSAFRVLEEGQPQTIRRFAEAADAPLRAALLVDRSTSMQPHVDQVAAAAQAFADAALSTADDRVAVLSFAEDTTIDQPFTESRTQVERALAGLRPLGRTALHDALVEGLNYFGDTEGLQALVLFTDGQDETSRLTLGQAAETARRSGVMVYIIGLETAFPDRAARRTMEDLARETGGGAHFVADLGALAQVYAEILEELRSRYLLAYEPAAGAAASGFREIEVDVAQPGVEVRARRGYYAD